MKHFLFIIIVVPAFCFIAAKQKFSFDSAIEDAKAKRYNNAIIQYDSLGLVYPQLITECAFNSAQLLWQSDSISAAIKRYQQILHQLNPSLRSRALNNIAVSELKEGKRKRALSTLKLALQEDETNEIARFNYELLRKRIQDDPPPPFVPPPPPPNGPPPSAKAPTEVQGASEPPSGASESEINSALKQLKERETQFFQSLRKSQQLPRSESETMPNR